MKILIISLLGVMSLPILAAETYSVVRCNDKQQRKVESSIADTVLSNNTFSERNYVLRSAVSITAVKEIYQKLGAAHVYLGKEGTVVTGFQLCTKNSKGDASLHEDIQLENDLNINELVKNGAAALDLDQSVYLGDEHIAVSGSTLKAKVNKIVGKDHLVEVIVDLTLNICDLTEIAEESDCTETHQTIKGAFKMSLPKTMQLK
jgi:hypothetical protein